MNGPSSKAGGKIQLDNKQKIKWEKPIKKTIGRTKSKKPLGKPNRKTKGSDPQPPHYLSMIRESFPDHWQT